MHEVFYLETEGFQQLSVKSEISDKQVEKTVNP